MQRLFLLVAVMLLSGCLTAPPKEAARPTLMPRAQSYKDLTHLPAPTGKIFVSVYNIQDETGQFKPYPASNFSTAVPQSATAMLVTALKDSRWFIPLERQGLQNLLNERKIIRAAQENGNLIELVLRVCTDPKISCPNTARFNVAFITDNRTFNHNICQIGRAHV